MNIFKLINIKKNLLQIKRLLKTESIENREMISTYYKMINKKASKEESEKANKQFQELIKTLGVGIIFILPLGMITLPLCVKIAKIFKIDIIPKSFQEFEKEDK